MRREEADKRRDGRLRGLIYIHKIVISFYFSSRESISVFDVTPFISCLCSLFLFFFGAMLITRFDVLGHGREKGKGCAREVG